MNGSGFHIDSSVRISDIVALVLFIAALAGFWASINSWMTKQDYRIAATEQAVQELKEVQVQSNEILNQLQIQNVRINQIFCDMDGNCPDGDYIPHTKETRK